MDIGDIPRENGLMIRFIYNTYPVSLEVLTVFVYKVPADV